MVTRHKLMRTQLDLPSCSHRRNARLKKMKSINQKSIYDDIFKFQTSIIFPLFVIIKTGASLPCASNSLLNKYYLSNYHLETPNNYPGITDSIELRYINIRQKKSCQLRGKSLTLQSKHGQPSSL